MVAEREINQARENIERPADHALILYIMIALYLTPSDAKASKGILLSLEATNLTIVSEV